MICRNVFPLLCVPLVAVASPPTWPEATRESKPWVYNWWMGGAVDEKGLEAQCAALAEKGFGGFHVIPIYGAKGFEGQYRKFLSPEWMRAFASAVRIGAAHGLGVDLTTGSGWCFGGPQIDATNGCWKLQRRLDGLPPYVEPVLTGQLVKRAGPGGEGPMMDPYSQDAMEAFLKPFTEAFDRECAARPVRMYHDSFEYYEAGWTPRLFEAFKAKRGYDLKDHWDEFAGGKGDLAAVARIKCDYRETLSDLIIDDVFPKWVDWCHSRGIGTRNEAHGSPANLLDFYALSDCPETEMFGRDNRDILISKFASSSAHVSGRKHVSAEACTWAGEHFCETPLDYKRMIDRLLVSGVDRIYYHGLCYSPADAPWPGWCFYAASETNPRNPLWRDFDAVNAYVTRIQSVMQSSESDNDLLVYWPIHDLWSDPSGFERMMCVHKTSWFDSQPFGRIARTLHELGCQFDYVSDRQLKHLRFGDGSYRTILVPAARTMPLATAQALVRLANEGFRVVFAERPPEAVPGFFEHERQSAQLRKLLAGSSKKFDCVQVVDFVGTLRVEPFTHAVGLSAWRRRNGDTTYYFVVNERPSAVAGEFRVSAEGGSAWEMDPMTGSIKDATAENGAVRISLAPHGSTLIAVSADVRTASPRPGVKFKPARAIDGPWTLTPVCGGPELPPSRTMHTLSSWSKREDGGEEPFCGTMLYRTRFAADGFAGRAAVIDLGTVCHSARARLNGRALGCRFVPPYRFDVPADALRRENELEVEVTNLGANRIRWNDQTGVEWKRFHDINIISVKGVWAGGCFPLDASDWPLRDSGLLGPVSIEVE